MIFINLRPNGGKVESYGISALYARDKKPFMEDLPVLFKLLEEGQIKPVISQKFPSCRLPEPTNCSKAELWLATSCCLRRNCYRK